MSENGMFGGKGSGDTSGFGGLVNSATVIAATQRPYGGYFDQVADDLERAYPLFSDAIEKVVVDRGELTLFIKAARLVDVAKILRDQLRFEMCVGVNGIHFPEETHVNCMRFIHCYLLLEIRELDWKFVFPRKSHIFLR